MPSAPQTKDVGVAMDINDYILSVSAREADVLRELRAETAKDSRSVMQVPVDEGQFLAFLVELTGARRVLEIGTYTGYSAIAMALALPEDGKLITMDISEEWTAIARRHWKAAGLDHKIELRIAPAMETLGALIADGQAGTFDLAFIDAGNKEMYVDYYESCLKLVRKGGLIVVDNTLNRGLVLPDADLSQLDPRRRERVLGVRRLNEHLHHDDRVALSFLAISDGVTLARKR
jgi:predicted O-methyltransferase YrrM